MLSEPLTPAWIFMESNALVYQTFRYWRREKGEQVDSARPKHNIFRSILDILTDRQEHKDHSLTKHRSGHGFP